jgi:hypothetical protein
LLHCRSDDKLEIAVPHSFYPRRQKLMSVITAVVSIAVIQVAFASAVVTGDFKDQEEYFGVSAEVIALTVSLTVAGFG